MKLLAIVALAVVAGGGCATVQKAPAAKAVHKRTRATTPSTAPVADAQPKPEEPAPAEPPATTENPEPELPSEEGLASYYADSLAGHRTASGEKYRPDVATCAHRTHPFGTLLEVTAIDSGAVSKCRVNDRGPYVKTRVLDVSKKVARELGMVGPGVLRVRVKPTREQGGGDSG